MTYHYEERRESVASGRWKIDIGREDALTLALPLPAVHVQARLRHHQQCSRSSAKDQNQKRVTDTI